MKNILLAVAGLSPQVITETLFALHQNRQTVDEIHVITTRNGKEKIYAELLGGEKGNYHTFLDEYGIDPKTIAFDHENVHVVMDEHGIEIGDILSAHDNERLLAKCMTLTFELTSRKDTAVFFSVAGGRKTMSSCLTLAVQLYGRSQDRLYHVLVSPEFESNREFFYPPKAPRKIELKDNHGQPFIKDTKYAQINLVNIPFVSIRKQISPDHLNEPKDPGTLMLSLIRDEEAGLTLNLKSRKLIYKTLELDLMPSHMALYAFFATVKKDCAKPGETCGDCRDCFLEMEPFLRHQDSISQIYQKLCQGRSATEMSDSGIIGLNPENFRSLRSKINKAIAAAFGPMAAKEIEISSTGSRPDTRYGILMDKARLEIVI